MMSQSLTPRERVLLALSHEETVDAATLRYLNRLSDAFFALARVENRRRGFPETLWDSKA